MQREMSGEDSVGGGGGGGDGTTVNTGALDYVLHVNLISGSDLFAAEDNKTKAQQERKTVAGAAGAAGVAAGVLLLLLLLMLYRFFCCFSAAILRCRGCRCVRLY